MKDFDWEDTVIEESVVFQNGSLHLSGILSYPSTATPSQSVLICSPHPNFGGSMDNNVVRALAQDLSLHALVLRFDYHGVGKSEIDLPSGVTTFDYWAKIEETHSYSAALCDVESALNYLRSVTPALSFSIIGYSFGAIAGLLQGMTHHDVRCLVGIAPPLTRFDFSFITQASQPGLLICGEDDFVFSRQAAYTIRQKAPSHVTLTTLAGLDHFFRNEEKQISERVISFLLQTA